eukprot:s200_g41.t2
MTSEYGNLWPVCSDVPSSFILTRKWGHSVLRQTSFICEMGARERAFRLSLELTLAGNDAFSTSVSIPRKAKSSTRAHLRVGFATVLDLHIGSENDFKMHTVRLPVDVFDSGLTPWSGCPHIAAMKFQSHYRNWHPDADPLSYGAVCISGLRLPFSLRQTLHSSCPAEVPVREDLFQCNAPRKVPPGITNIMPPVSSFRVPTHQTVANAVHEYNTVNHIEGPADVDQDVPPPVPVLPNFARTILEGDHRPVDDDWTQGLTIRTWFLHLPNHPQCDQPRLLQLVGNALTWRQQIIALWNDLVVLGAFLDVYIVDPAPPRPSTLGHVAYDILVEQSDGEIKGGLVTAMTPHEPWTYWSIAIFLPRHIGGLHIVERAHLADVCQQYRCMIFHGWTELPLSFDPVHQMADGHSFSVHLQISATASSSSTGLAHVLPSQEHVPAPPIVFVPDELDAEEDLEEFGNWLLSEEEAEEAADQASSGYSPSQHEGIVDLANLKSLTVYGLYRDPFHIYVRWGPYADTLVDIANRLAIPLDQILTFHNLAVRAAGQLPNEESVILQRVVDIPVGSTDQLILLDVEIHQHPAPHAFPAFPQVVRKVCRIVQHVARSSLLIQAGVLHYCAHQLDRCLVHVNHDLWPLQDVALRTLPSGTYVRVTVPPPWFQRVGTLFLIDATERRFRNDLPEGVHPYQRPVRVPQEDGPLPGVAHHGLQEHSSGRSGPDPYFQTVRPTPHTDPQPSSLPPLYHNHWLLPTGMRVLQQIDGTTNQDDFEVEWITWYLGAPHRPRCDETRILRLDVEQELWYQDLCELWHEYLQPDAPTQVLVVDPNPPRAPYEHHVGHLILVQGELEGHVPVVITTIFHNAYRISHYACFVPRFSSTATFIAFLRLERVFLARECSATIAGFDIPADGIGEVHAGDNVILHVPARTQDTASFLQLGVRLSPPLLPPVDAQEPVACHFPNDPAGLRNDYLGAYQQQTPFIVDIAPFMMGFEQELLLRWPQFAQPGPGGVEMQLQVRTWFNDHERWPICDSPRDTGLFEDVNTWRVALLHTWRDRIDPAYPVDFYLVDPDPTAEHDQIAAHLILVQRPQEDMHSVLISVSDDTIWNGYPRRWAIRCTSDPTGLEIVALMGYRLLCPPQIPDAQCFVICRQARIGMQERFLTNHGLSIDMQVFRRHVAAELSFSSAAISEQGSCVRPTDSAVAHACRPQDSQLSNMTLCLDDLLPQESIAPMVQTHFPIRLIPGATMAPLPTFIECLDPACEKLIREELRHWGHDCDVFRFGGHPTALCFPSGHSPLPDLHHYMFCHDDVADHDGAFLHSSAVHMNDLDIMRFLYQCGYWRATITGREEVKPHLERIRFDNVVVNAAPHNKPLRPTPLWPAAPSRPTAHGPFFVPPQNDASSNALLKLNISLEEVEAFFTSGDGVLCRDPAGLELPATTQAVFQLSQSTDLDSFDRIVIYTDGSSFAEHRHRPPLWNDEHGYGDTWSFVVLGETFTSQGSRVEVIGWTSQPIHYASESSFYIGAQHIGSFVAEREAMTWAGLWRLSQNSRVDTVFRTDSWTTAQQSCGDMGVSTIDDSFKIFRGVFQALEVALRHEAFQVQHLHGHTNEPYNDMVDYLAKCERERSFYHLRQKINMNQWRTLIPHFWMVLSTNEGIPVFCRNGFDVCPPALPPAQRDGTEIVQTPQLSSTSDAQLHLSIGSANVTSMYSGEWGHGGKLDFLRKQFVSLGLTFLGLQEARTPDGFGHTDGVLRYASGSTNGQYGVEFWVNCQIPYAYVAERPHCFAAGHFQVLHQDPRLLSLRVDAPYLQCYVHVGHAPHNGHDKDTRETWWSELSTALNACVAGVDHYVILDGNADPGDRDDVVVFSDKFKSTANTSLLRAFLEEQSLYLPCTTNVHFGAVDTWTSPDEAHSHCIDYIAIPRHCQVKCTYSSLLPDFDLGNNYTDHVAVAIQLQWQEMFATPSSQRHQRPQYDKGRVTSDIISTTLRHFVPPSWRTDVETYVDAFNSHVLTDLSHACPVRHQRPKKPYIDDTAWHHRDRKLQARRHLKELHQRTSFELLSFVLRSWRQPSEAIDLGAVFWAYQLWLDCVRFRLKTQFLCHAHRLRQHLRSLKQKHIRSVFENLADDSPAGTILHELRQIVGPTNLKKVKSQPLPYMFLMRKVSPARLPAKL